MLIQKDNLGKVAVTVEKDYWSINKDYDKLTIVEKEGSFGTYISRKPVPAGKELTDRDYWIPFSSLKEEIVLQFGELVNRVNNLDKTIEEKEEEIYKAMASISAGGIALKQSFGDSELVGISQKVITEKVDDLQDQINKLHPSTFGIKLTITPNIIYEEQDTNITIKVETLDEEIADNIKIIIDDEIISETVDSDSLEITELISENKVIRAEAIKDGFSYEAETEVKTTRPYYIGAGEEYNDILTDAYKQSIKLNPIGTYNINVENNANYLFFVVPDSMTINNVTMNGFNVPLNPPEEVIIIPASGEGFNYKVYKSINTYDSGLLTVTIL